MLTDGNITCGLNIGNELERSGIFLIPLSGLLTLVVPKLRNLGSNLVTDRMCY